MMTTAFPLLLLVLLVGCAAATPAPLPPTWSPAFEAPRALATERVVLEPLGPEHAEADFAALMGSREHLRRTLRWGDWPRADFTLAENRDDLVRHAGEFERREAYAYTVLAPDRQRCLGCVYLSPVPEGAEDEALLHLWVIEPALASGLDEHLLRALFDWFDRDWSLRRVVLPTRADDERRVRTLRALGCGTEPPTTAEHVRLVRESGDAPDG